MPQNRRLASTAGTEIGFEAEKALEHTPAEERASFKDEYEARLFVIGKGKGSDLAF